MADRQRYLIRGATRASFVAALGVLALRIAYLSLRVLFGPAMPPIP